MSGSGGPRPPSREDDLTQIEVDARKATATGPTPAAHAQGIAKGEVIRRPVEDAERGPESS